MGSAILGYNTVSPAPALLYRFCTAALGLGAVHCVVNGTKYKQSQRTTAGAEKWLDVKVWTSTNECLGGLKKAGYQIVTTHLSDNSVTIQVRLSVEPIGKGTLKNELLCQ